MGKFIVRMAASVFFLLVPLHAVSKDLFPAGQSVQAPQKTLTPEQIKPLPPPAPPQTTKPVIGSYQVRNMRAVPAGEEVEVVLTGKSLHRLTSAKVMQGALEVREIKVIPGLKTPTGWTLKLSGKKRALGKAGLRLQLMGGGPPLVVPLSGELKKARGLAGLKETPMVPIPSEKQRQLEKIKERERALETAQPLLGGKPQITGVVPSRGAAGATVQIRGMNLGKPADRFLWVTHEDTDGRSTAYSSGMVAPEWSNTQITARIPEDAPEGTLKISVAQGRPPFGELDSILSNQVFFTVLNPLRAAVAESVGTETGIPGVAGREIAFQKEVSLTPSRTGVERVHRTDSGGLHCVDRRGLGEPLPTYYDLPVGYLNSYDPGTEPLPCWSSSNSTYLTRASFSFPGTFASRRVESALLKYTELDVVGWNREYCTRASISLVRNDTAWEAGDRTVREHNRNWSVLKQMNPSSDSYGNFDITDWVRGWLAGTYPNHGVTILGWDYSYAKNNRQCAAHIRHITLTVRFTD